MGWDDAIGDAIGDAIADAVDEILTDDDAAAEAAAAAAEAEAATAEAEAAAEAEQTGETAYGPNFPKYWSIEKDGEFWTDPLTGVIWKYLGDDQWEDTGNIPGAVDDTGGVAGEDVAGEDVAGEGAAGEGAAGEGAAGEGAAGEGAASSSEPLPEIVSKAKLLENGFPIGATAVLVAGVLYTLIAGTAGGSGYWINSETLDAYTPGGQPIDPKVMDEIVSSGKALETVDWSKIFEGALGIAGLAGIGVPELWEMLFGGENGGEEQSWWQKLVEAYLDVQAGKGLLDTIKYKVPTGQGAAMSAYEKANPLDIDMGLESLGPNYLQDQLYGIPIGAENVPAATHTLGFPYAEEIPVETEEEVQGAQRGGIMNARSHGDIVPALLEPGEFVMNLQSVKGAGNGDARQGAKRMYKMMRQLERMGQ